jgi:phosphoribosylanthranilate isomerase
MKIKVCGMKYAKNIQEVALLEPNYMGFIFHKDSSRYIGATSPEIPKNIIKTGVFVNTSLAQIIKCIEEHHLQAIQLHGNESAAFCAALKKEQPTLDIIKVFAIKDRFDFTALEPFETVCDYFLFDTKGTLPGGNGFVFNWNILLDYPSTKPYFLSGGIGYEQLDQLKKFMHSDAGTYCYAVDLNSQFETAPAIKNYNKLRDFKNHLNTIRP